MTGNDTKPRPVRATVPWRRPCIGPPPVLVLVAFIYGPGGSEQRVYSPARDFDRRLHETLGLCVLVLVAVRVLWRMVDPAACSSPTRRAGWQWRQGLCESALYLLLFLVPFTAILGAWLEGHPVTLLAGVEFPPMLATAHDAGAAVARIHAWLGDAILWLAGLHAVAALHHHFLLKDDVLASMLPPWLPLRNTKMD